MAIHHKEETVMEEVIAIAALIVIVTWAIYSIVKRIRFGSSCCGTKTPPDKKVRVKDRNKTNYPYEYVLKVDRMHCSNCARRIENAFNSTAGRWAKADLENSEVRLFSKHEETQQDLSDIVSSAGYVMSSYIPKIK